MKIQILLLRILVPVAMLFCRHIHADDLDTFQASIFGSYDFAGDGEYGSGLALTLFPIKSAPLLGFQAEVQRNRFDGSIKDDIKLAGSVVLRYPLPKLPRVTVYALAGGGTILNYTPSDSDDNAYFGQVGGGFQVKITGGFYFDTKVVEEFRRSYDNSPRVYAGFGFGF